MNQYDQIRSKIQTGDIFGVEGRGIVGTLIRVLTGQQLSHVAMLINKGVDGIWVAEFVEGKGYQMLPASVWLSQRVGKKHFLYWGSAPVIVRRHRGLVKRFIGQFRPENHNTGYSYLTLLRVWWSQLTRKKRSGAYVCSTFAQRAWESAGYDKFEQLADPGDFMRHCKSITHLRAT